MKELEKLLDRIIQRININLRELDYDISPFIKNLVPLNQMVKLIWYSDIPVWPAVIFWGKSVPEIRSFTKVISGATN
jgi:hypothetical protein